MNYYILIILTLIISHLSLSQNTPQGVSIANDQVPPSKNAMFDVVSSEKGILIPRVSFETISLSTSPLYKTLIAANPEEAGLLVFVVDETVNHGFWYFDHKDDLWKKLGTSDFSIPILTWEQMHALPYSANDRGKLVYVSDCEYTYAKDPGTATINVRGLYYFDDVGFVQGQSVLTGCGRIKRWVRVTDGRVISSRPTGAVCTSGGYSNNCMDYGGGTTGYINFPTINESPTLFQIENNLAQLSDSTVKKEITPILSVLDKIKEIDGVYYYWITSDKSTNRQMGVIAQDVQRVFPEAVEIMENGKMGVKYELLVAPLIESIKAQQLLIENQQTQIYSLLKRVESLEK